METIKQSKGFDDVWFYHCDYLGTPQEMSDHVGVIIWKAEYIHSVIKINGLSGAI